MNFDLLKQRAAYLAQQSGSVDAVPQPDWGTLVNNALKEFSWHAEYMHDTFTFTTVASQAKYQINTSVDWKRVTSCVYNNVSQLIETDETQLTMECPNWYLTTNGVPTRFLISVSNTVRLYPTPSTSSVSVSVRGIVVDDPLVNSTDTPNCSSVFTEAVALLAAYRHIMPFAVGEGLQKAQAYYQEAYKIINDCRYATMAQRVRPAVRYVRRHYPPRTSLSGYIRYY